MWLVGDEVDHLRQDADLEDLLDVIRAGDEEQALLVNEWMIARGFATFRPAEDGVPLIHQSRLRRAEGLASRDLRGMWGECKTETP